MEIQEVDTASMPKNMKTEQEQQLVHVKRRNTKRKMKQKNVEKNKNRKSPKQPSCKSRNMCLMDRLQTGMILKMTS